MKYTSMTLFYVPKRGLMVIPTLNNGRHYFDILLFSSNKITKLIFSLYPVRKDEEKHHQYLF